MNTLIIKEKVIKKKQNAQTKIKNNFIFQKITYNIYSIYIKLNIIKKAIINFLEN